MKTKTKRVPNKVSYSQRSISCALSKYENASCTEKRKRRGSIKRREQVPAADTVEASPISEDALNMTQATHEAENTNPLYDDDTTLLGSVGGGFESIIAQLKEHVDTGHKDVDIFRALELAVFGAALLRTQIEERRVIRLQLIPALEDMKDKYEVLLEEEYDGLDAFQEACKEVLKAVKELRVATDATKDAGLTPLLAYTKRGLYEGIINMERAVVTMYILCIYASRSTP